MTKPFNHTLFIGCLLLPAGIGLSSPAFAAKPWISVPSTAQNQQLVVSGGDLSPNSTVNLKITQPDSLVTSQIVAVNSEGKLNLEYPVGMPGSYTVSVYDMAGNLIGGGTMGFIR